MTYRGFLDNFWYGDGGIKRLLKIAFPLIMSTSSFTIMQFVDRKFLMTYSTDAFQASAPAGMMAFLFVSFFFGTVAYVNSFVAQYSGAKKFDRVGSSIWQAFYLVLISWCFLLPTIFISDWLFALAGHSKAVQHLESQYFQILTIGSGFVLFNIVLSSFYSGRGKTWTVMLVRFIAVFINIPLDYCMIFGKYGFPEMGMRGAAWATVISTTIATLIFAILVFSKRNREKYGTVRGYRFDKDLFKRLVKFGVPSGVQFVIDILGFTIFLMMIGRLGRIELAATNATWSLNSLIFMPMIGISIALSTMVGQSVGAKKIEVAIYSTRNAFILVFTYMTTMAICYVVTPGPFLSLLLTGGNPYDVKLITELSIVFLRFVALYSLFDSFAIVFATAIKAAGDTRFVMWVTTILCITLLIIPSLLLTVVWKVSGTTLWIVPTIFIITGSIIFFLRYRQGKWMDMRVIEY